MFSPNFRGAVSLCFLVLIAGFANAQSSDSLISQLGRKWQNAENYTLLLASSMPEEFYNFKPVPEERSFKEQLLHTAQNIEWLSSSFLFVEKKSAKQNPDSLSKEAVLQVLKQAYNLGLTAHKNILANQLDEPVKFFAGPMTRRQILFLMHDHQTHHLGQLIVYLRLKGIAPPAYVGW